MTRARNERASPMLSQLGSNVRNGIGKRSATPSSKKRRVRLQVEQLEAREPLSFQHPGLLYTQADFDRMSSNVNAGAQPWLAGWNALISNGYSQLGANPRPRPTVSRGATGPHFMPDGR